MMVYYKQKGEVQYTRTSCQYYEMFKAIARAAAAAFGIGCSVVV